MSYQEQLENERLAREAGLRGEPCPTHIGRSGQDVYAQAVAEREQRERNQQKFLEDAASGPSGALVLGLVLAAALLIVVVLPALVGAVFSGMALAILWRDRRLTFGQSWFACAFGGGLLLVIATAICIAAMYIAAQLPPDDPDLWLPGGVAIVGVAAVALALPAEWAAAVEADLGTLPQMMAESGIGVSALLTGTVVLLLPSSLAAALALRFSARHLFPGFAGLLRATAFTFGAILPGIAIALGLVFWAAWFVV